MNLGVFLLTILTAALVVVLFLAGGPASQPNLLLGIFLLSLFDLAIYLVELSQRRRLARLAEALDEGGAEVIGGVLSPRRVEGHFRGREVTLKCTPHSRGTPSTTTIQLACSSSLHFEFWSASPFRLIKPRHSFQLGDAQVDREFSFVSQDGDRVLSWLRRPEKKDMVLAMLRRGMVGTRLESRQGYLFWIIQGTYKLRDAQELVPLGYSMSPGVHFGVVAVRGTGLRANLDRDIMREALESLTQLAVALEVRA